MNTTTRTLLIAIALSALGVALPAQAKALDLRNGMGNPESGYIVIPHAPELEPETITIEAWITPRGIGQGTYVVPIGAMIVGKVKQGVNPLSGSSVASWWLGWSPSAGQATAGFSHQLAGDGVGAGNGTFITNGQLINFGERRHVAFTYDGHRVAMFTGGQQTAGFLASIPYLPIQGYEQTPVLIGAANSCCTWNQRFDGTVDEIRIWDHARTETQIARHMNCRLKGTESGLVGYWRFDGRSLRDMSGNGNHGEAIGPAWGFRDTLSLKRCGPRGKIKRPLEAPIPLPGFTLPSLVDPRTSFLRSLFLPDRLWSR